MIPSIAIILGSTRESRQGERVAKWTLGVLGTRTDCNVTLIDLRDWPLPFYAEAKSPSALHGEYSIALAKDWSKTIASYNAFVMVTPEYNHGYPAVLKNALDYLYTEWQGKPAACVSYSSGGAAGIRAVQQLRQVFIELQLIPILAEVNIPYVTKQFNEQGDMFDEHYVSRLNKVTDEILSRLPAQ